MPFSGFGILKLFAQGNFSAVRSCYILFYLFRLSQSIHCCDTESWVLWLPLFFPLVDAVAFSGPFYLISFYPYLALLLPVSPNGVGRLPCFLAFLGLDSEWKGVNVVSEAILCIASFILFCSSLLNPIVWFCLHIQFWIS